MLKTELIVLIIGWLLGTLQLLLIEFIKKRLDKRAFRKLMKNDIKLIIDDLKRKEQEIKEMLKLPSDATLNHVIQGTTDRLIWDGIKIPDDFYKENYVKILEDSEHENLIKFYKRIQLLNYFADSSKEYRGIIELARILNTQYWTKLFEAIREGENISI